MSELLDTLLEDARARTEPDVVAALDVAAGGVDPLGLRQINFDLMDRVIPGLNNVARHVRPFTFMTWAWRRARHVLGDGEVEADLVRNFVDRLETVFAWSQFLLDSNADLPGSQALVPLLRSGDYRFSGGAWEKFRDVRRYSTGLAAPVNYGPALRSLQWLGDGGKPGVLKPNPQLEGLLDEFEDLFAAHLAHPLFNTFAPVTVTRDDAERWGERWYLHDLLGSEREAAHRALCGDLAPPERKAGVALIQASAVQSSELIAVRRSMADQFAASGDPQLSSTAQKWRTVQVRQLFRLALEALLRWTCSQVIDQAATTEELASRFLDEVFAVNTRPDTSLEWLAWQDPANDNPVDRLTSLQAALREDSEVERSIADALLFCLSVTSGEPDLSEAVERLPLWRAKAEFDAIAPQSPLIWISHAVEVWVLGQHIYWSVGRGLADARGGGKTLLRLRVTMEEGGWRMLPGASVGSRPEATPDRLATVLSLLRECGRLESAGV